ncbi:MAG: TCP-1/cpn60 chaperonin family protein [Thermoplasmata archaeon]|nr:TCP-1/cpn60 chaperonin family protein [Candidatus Thermoplasmatota archaeon]MCK4949142.1 TCP-1/cpn60 chaperonin family protein [Thermoplasmata archaeon]
MFAGQPIILLKEGTERTRGRSAQSNSIAAAKAVAEAVRSTLGPRGMDKMLVDSMGDVVITNDGATILKEIDIEHPAAKMVVEVAKTQDDEAGDGTTSAVVLAGELLKKSEDLIEQNVHPTIVVNGFRMAAEKAMNVLDKMAVNVRRGDKKKLLSIATTSIGGRSMGAIRNHLATMAVDAVSKIVEERDGTFIADTDNIKVEKKHGASVLESELIDGMIIDKERVHPRMPKWVKNAKIALINSALEIKKTEVDAKIQITDPSQMERFLQEEEKTLKRMVDKLKKSGANAVFCQKGIDDLVQHYLAKDGIYALRRIKKSDMDKLSKATGGKIVTNLEDLGRQELGKAGLIEEKKIGDDDMTFVTGCKDSKAVSIIVRGGTEHVVDEVERALHDAIRVVGVAIEDGKAIPGGGATEIEVSLRLRDYASTVGGREQLAIEAFADALEIIPWTLGENAGLDSIDLLIELRSKHEGKKANKNAGVDVYSGKVKDMIKLNVIEPIRVKTQAVKSATDVAAMILRIDDIIASKKMEGPPPGAGAPGGMGGMGGMPPGMM